MSNKHVAVIRGGPSTEYEISMITGNGVLQALYNLGYTTKDIVIDRKGAWLVNGYERTPMTALADVDVVFLALHGAYGEDGGIQRQLEQLSIPYTGSGPYASRMAFNKHFTKEHLKDAQFKFPRHQRLTKDGVTNPTKTANSMVHLLGSDFVVKPVTGGSSIDTVVVHAGQLASAITNILEKYDEAMVEERIIGREATVGVLDNFRNERYYALPEIEIIPPAKSAFFSADVKYTGETQEIVPGRFSRAEKQKLAEAAQYVHKTLGLSQYSRSDFMVKNGEVYFLEVDTLPGLTNQSLFPKSVEAVGSNYQALIDHLIKTAKSR